MSPTSLMHVLCLQQVPARVDQYGTGPAKRPWSSFTLWGWALLKNEQLDSLTSGTLPALTF